MRALASGPFGVLIMVAPLVAIPILSTFGIPQFAPLVAAPSEADENVEIVATLPEESFNDPQPASPESPTRTADDLFAPLDAPRTAPRPTRELAGRSTPDTMSTPETSSGLVPLISPASPQRSAEGPRRQRLDSPDAGGDALSGWDVVPLDGSAPAPSPEIGAGEPAADTLTPPTRTPQPDAGLRLPEDFGSSEVTPGSLEGELTWKGAQKQLNEYGIHKFVLESTLDGGFQFRCAVTDPDNPQVDRQFRTQATEPLLAVQKALDQIEDYRAQQ
jgi:hypothetical protein